MWMWIERLSLKPWFTVCQPATDWKQFLVTARLAGSIVLAIAIQAQRGPWAANPCCSLARLQLETLAILSTANTNDCPV